MYRREGERDFRGGDIRVDGSWCRLGAKQIDVDRGAIMGLLQWQEEHATDVTPPQVSDVSDNTKPPMLPPSNL